MGIREKLNENPAITTVATAAIVIIAIGFIVWQLMPSSSSIPTQDYFSDDDGASYYKDDIKLIPPYDHNGKEAVRARVFKCASGSAFIGYLEKFTPEAKKQLESGKTTAPGPVPAFNPMMEMAMMNGRLVKAPGAGHQWLTPRHPDYAKVVEPKCPDGSADISPVMP